MSSTAAIFVTQPSRVPSISNAGNRFIRIFSRSARAPYSIFFLLCLEIRSYVRVSMHGAFSQYQECMTVVSKSTEMLNIDMVSFNLSARALFRLLLFALLQRGQYFAVSTFWHWITNILHWRACCKRRRCFVFSCASGNLSDGPCEKNDNIKVEGGVLAKLVNGFAHKYVGRLRLVLFTRSSRKLQKNCGICVFILCLENFHQQRLILIGCIHSTIPNDSIIICRSWMVL